MLDGRTVENNFNNIVADYYWIIIARNNYHYYYNNNRTSPPIGGLTGARAHACKVSRVGRRAPRDLSLPVN